MSVFTVEADYSATGEGVTYMIMFTRAYPLQEDYKVKPSFVTKEDGTIFFEEGELKYPREQVAINEFTKLFGSYYALGATVKEGLHFDNPSAKRLVSPELQAKLIDWEKEAGGFEYHASLHLNFS